MNRRCQHDLGDLADPSKFTKSLNIDGWSVDKLRDLLRMMLSIRRAEEIIADLVEEGEIKCPCHLGIGQEAVAVGISNTLRNTDRVFGGHRSHAHYLALGGDVKGLFAEVLGRVTGCSKGMGGSMHLYQADTGFLGSVPIVGATIPIAVGAGLAAKKDGKGDVAICYFGDGAAEEGVLHESLNLASVLGLPVIFVCENNLFASHLEISLRQASDLVARFAEAHRVPFRIVDGNDVVGVSEAAHELVVRSRAGQGPGFLEAITYRWRGHVGSSEDIDVGVKRSREDLMLWKERDPIRRLSDAMLEENHIDATEYQMIVNQVDETLKEAIDKALKDPYPDKSALLELVFTKIAE